jgi:glucose/arabinose dehydrogenase
MTLLPSKHLSVALTCAAFFLLVAWTTYGAAIAVTPATVEVGIEPELTPSQEGRGGTRGGGRGGAGGGGRGRGRGAPVDTLGEGPWDISTEEGSIHVTVVTRGVDHPWGMAFLPNGDMLVTERSGRLRVIRDGILDPTPISGLPDIQAGLLGGLLDISLHPDFEENRLIYFAYSKPGEDVPARATTAVARANWDGGSQLDNLEDVLVADGYLGGPDSPRGCCGQGPASASFGTRIVFDDAGLLFITVGDRNYGEVAQDPSTHIGKILRVRDDGTVPPDNPFVGMDGYKPEIYTLGHRNPLGLTIDSATGRLWSTEFGPRGGDELNLIEAGKNYGWILVTEGAHYDGTPTEAGANSVPGMEDPVLFWVPSINPGNLLFYHGDQFPQWEGNMIMAAMSRSILRATFDAEGNPTGQERMMTELNQRFRDVRMGPDGFIYALTDETLGAVLRIEPGD